MLREPRATAHIERIRRIALNRSTHIFVGCGPLLPSRTVSPKHFQHPCTLPHTPCINVPQRTAPFHRLFWRAIAMRSSVHAAGRPFLQRAPLAGRSGTLRLAAAPTANALTLTFTRSRSHLPGRPRPRSPPERPPKSEPHPRKPHPGIRMHRIHPPLTLHGPPWLDVPSFPYPVHLSVPSRAPAPMLLLLSVPLPLLLLF
jgi:hypothetical protein